MDELWKPIGTWEGLYEVSDLGRVRSLARVKTLHHGGRREYGGKTLSGCEDSNGYWLVNLRDASRNRHSTYKVHTLVLRAFVGPPPPGLIGCHRDDNKANNALSNLRWDTSASNSQDMIRNGNSLRGSKNPQSKLTEQAVAKIRQSPLSQRSIAKQFNVSKSLVGMIRVGKAWAHLSASCNENIAEIT